MLLARHSHIGSRLRSILSPVNTHTMAKKEAAVHIFLYPVLRVRAGWTAGSAHQPACVQYTLWPLPSRHDIRPPSHARGRVRQCAWHPSGSAMTSRWVVHRDKCNICTNTCRPYALQPRLCHHPCSRLPRRPAPRSQIRDKQFERHIATRIHPWTPVVCLLCLQGNRALTTDLFGNLLGGVLGGLSLAPHLRAPGSAP
jgi:hypothetical protein